MPDSSVAACRANNNCGARAQLQLQMLHQMYAQQWGKSNSFAVSGLGKISTAVQTQEVTVAASSDDIVEMCARCCPLLILSDDCYVT